VSERPDFVVFSDDWGEHPSSCQHLFRQIARDHRVIWVNTVGMRAPKLTLGDVRRAYLKVRKMLLPAGPQAAASGAAAVSSLSAGLDLHVLQPPMIPLPSSSLARRFNARSAETAIRARMRQLGIERPVVVSTVPNACDVVGRLGAAHVVYYCVDDFAQWPGLDHAAVHRMEQSLIRQSDVLLATSDALQRALQRDGRQVHLFPHGVDLEFFGQPSGDEHPAVAPLQRPRAGFYGNLDERVDAELIEAVARARPEWMFVFAGPQAVRWPQLEALPNVRFIGAVAYRDLPRLADALDVLLLPYHVNAFTQTISPLKLNEYLASGRPVISAALHESEKRMPLVRIARGVEEWSGALAESLADDRDTRREAARRLLATESWAAKAKTLLEFCRAPR
jgi:glycosyltransferase involved in cell wall biosynthesis